jgi:hypothetical protein
MNRLFAVTLAASVALVGCTKDDGDTGPVEINYAPTAEAGPDQLVTAGDLVTLDGSGSFDPDADALFYEWAFESVPEGSTVMDAERPFQRNGTAEAVATGFTTDVVGTYVVALRVHDSKDWSVIDYLVVTAELPDSDARPVADAGANLFAEVDDTVTLDGSRSYDPKGLDLAYAWTLLSAPAGSSLDQSGLTGADTPSATFTADNYGVFSFSLVVDNGLLTSEADLIQVTVTGDSEAPVANAGEDINGMDCMSISLDGTSSTDAEGDALTYMWEVQQVPAGSDVTNDSLSDRASATPDFYADKAGTYKLSLTVNDGQRWSTPDTVVLTLTDRDFNTPPSVSVGTPDTIAAGWACCEVQGYGYTCDECSDQSFTFDSSMISVADADGDPVTIEWTVTSGSAAFADTTDLVASVTLEDIEPVEPGACEANTFELALTVTDCTDTPTVSNVTITAECCGADSDDTAIDCSE